VVAGYRISTIATLDATSLRDLLMQAPPSLPQEMPALAQRPRHEASQNFEARCVEAIQRMDACQFEDTLTQALITLGHQGLLRKVVAPLVQSIGRLWTEGTLSAAHEHFASAFLKNFLGNAARPFAAGDGTPSLIVATPTGQLHELGAVIIASSARNLGWRVVYLGASLPAAEIAGAAMQNRAQAVALSLVYPSDDPHLAKELANLRKFLPSEIRILAGGRSAGAYLDILNAIGAVRIEDLDAFCSQLEELRGARAAA